MTKRLFQALMLAAALGLTLPATSEASTITVQLSYGTGTNQSDTAKFFNSCSECFFSGFAFQFELIFDNVITPFTVDVTADDSANLSFIPPGYICVPIDGTNCILFTATPSSIGWAGGFRTNIAWDFNTDPQYPNIPVNQNGLGRIRVLHLIGSAVNDITVPGSYCTTCGVDPGISGRADNFSGFIVTQTTAAVPEPTSLLLLGSGVVGLVALKRRQRKLKA